MDRTVKQEVIPRLVAMPWLRLRDIEQTAPVSELAAPIDEVAINRLVALCFDLDGQAVAAFVAGLNRQGASAETLYTNLLTPAARLLGEMWENDDCNFADVTIGLVRLQNAQRALTSDFVGQATARLAAPRVLLMPVPGEQHTFGLSMVMDFFRRAGWDSWLGIVDSDAEALQFVKREPADMIGLSFACDDRIDSAAMLIANFRRVSANKKLLVIVGGPAFMAEPTLAARIGADGTALDGHQAVMLAHDLLNQTVERP